MPRTISQIRRDYRGLTETGHKQMGLRALQEAGWLGTRNPERTAELIAKAEFHLPYAVAHDLARRA